MLFKFIPLGDPSSILGVRLHGNINLELISAQCISQPNLLQSVINLSILDKKNHIFSLFLTRKFTA